MWMLLHLHDLAPPASYQVKKVDLIHPHKENLFANSRWNQHIPFTLRKRREGHRHRKGEAIPVWIKVRFIDRPPRRKEVNDQRTRRDICFQHID